MVSEEINKGQGGTGSTVKDPKMERQIKDKRIGRPIKPPAPGERTQIGVQVTPNMKRRLEAAAERNYRSLSREAELRLERSFDREDLLPQVLGLAYGDDAVKLLMRVGHSWLRGAVRTKDEILAAGKTLEEAAGEGYVFILEGDEDEATERKTEDSLGGATRNHPTGTQASLLPTRGKIGKRDASPRKLPASKKEFEQ